MGADYSFYVKSIATTYAPTSLRYNNSVLAIVHTSMNFLMSVNLISIFLSLSFPNPVLMVLKFLKVKYLVLIKVVLLRLYCLSISSKKNNHQLYFNIGKSVECTAIFPFYTDCFLSSAVFQKDAKRLKI